MTDNNIVDKSSDHKYFLQTPQIVLALCRNPYDFTLWSVIKMIAGEYKQCILSTDDLATLAMMSTGKVSDSRTYLLSVGLLEGNFYRDPGYPQPIWHLRVPDIWLKNIEWRQLYDGLKDRIELKSRLKALFDEADIYRRFNLEIFQLLDSFQNVNVKSLHNMKPSQNDGGVPQNDGGVPQNDGGVPQNEAKKNHIEPKRRRKKKNHLPPENQAGSSKEPEPQKPTTTPQQMFSALADLCRYDLSIITDKERGQLNQAEKKLREKNYTPADLKEFETWWYAHDWRGQKGQPPTMNDIRQTWGQFKHYRQNGATKNGNSRLPGTGANQPKITGLRYGGQVQKRVDLETGRTYYYDLRRKCEVPGPDPSTGSGSAS